jgi:hypothetical protein
MILLSAGFKDFEGQSFKISRNIGATTFNKRTLSITTHSIAIKMPLEVRCCAECHSC